MPVLEAAVSVPVRTCVVTEMLTMRPVRAKADPKVCAPKYFCPCVGEWGQSRGGGEGASEQYAFHY